MLVVKIELWPKGVKEDARSLGVMHISNNATGTRESGNYDVQLFAPDGTTILKQACIKGFPRQILGGWNLLYKALKATIDPKQKSLAFVCSASVLAPFRWLHRQIRSLCGMYATG